MEELIEWLTERLPVERAEHAQLSPPARDVFLRLYLGSETGGRVCIVSSWFAPEMVQDRRMWPDILQIITDEWEQAQAERGAE